MLHAYPVARLKKKFFSQILPAKCSSNTYANARAALVQLFFVLFSDAGVRKRTVMCTDMDK